MPTLIGTGLIIIILLRLFTINSIDNAKVEFIVKSIGVEEEVNLRIEFKEGGVFRFVEPSKLGPTYAYGSYEVIDSVIVVSDFDFPGYDFKNDWSFINDTLYAGETKFILVDK